VLFFIFKNFTSFSLFYSLHKCMTNLKQVEEKYCVQIILKLARRLGVRNKLMKIVQSQKVLS